MRSYDQFCGLARALDVVGERWTLLLVRDLLTGPKRFKDLQSCLPGLATNLLARRLRRLVELGLGEKRRLDHGVDAYALTPAGLELEPAVMALAKFGTRYMGTPREGDAFDMAWGLLSMKRRYLAGEGHVGIQLGERAFHIRFSPEYVDVQQGSTPTPVTAHITEESLRRLLWMGGASSEIEAAGELRLEGPSTAWTGFLEAFGLRP